MGRLLTAKPAATLWCDLTVLACLERTSSLQAQMQRALYSNGQQKKETNPLPISMKVTRRVIAAEASWSLRWRVACCLCFECLILRARLVRRVGMNRVCVANPYRIRMLSATYEV